MTRTPMLLAAAATAAAAALALTAPSALAATPKTTTHHCPSVQYNAYTDTLGLPVLEQLTNLTASGGATCADANLVSSIGMKYVLTHLSYRYQPGPQTHSGGLSFTTGPACMTCVITSADLVTVHWIAGFGNTHPYGSTYVGRVHSVTGTKVVTWVFGYDILPTCTTLSSGETRCKSAMPSMA